MRGERDNRVGHSTAASRDEGSIRRPLLVAGSPQECDPDALGSITDLLVDGETAGFGGLAGVHLVPQRDGRMISLGRAERDNSNDARRSSIRLCPKRDVGA